MFSKAANAKAVRAIPGFFVAIPTTPIALEAKNVGVTDIPTPPIALEAKNVGVTERFAIVVTMMMLLV
jgi:hypothetical protein